MSNNPCNCFTDILDNYTRELMGVYLKDRPHVKGSIKVSLTDAPSFILSDTPRLPIPIRISATYRKLKKDNTPAARETKLQNNFIMKYCPICGVKWDEKNA